MLRGEVWWARLPPPMGLRPVVLLSRDRALQVRTHAVVAQVSRTIRDLPSEVRLGTEDGMPKPCAVSADTLHTIPKTSLSNRICRLSPEKLMALAEAVKFALALE